MNPSVEKKPLKLEALPKDKLQKIVYVNLLEPLYLFTLLNCKHNYKCKYKVFILDVQLIWLQQQVQLLPQLQQQQAAAIGEAVVHVTVVVGEAIVFVVVVIGVAVVLDAAVIWEKVVLVVVVK